jgi:hypothetical protein
MAATTNFNTISTGCFLAINEFVRSLASRHPLSAGDGATRD